MINVHCLFHLASCHFHLGHEPGEDEVDNVEETPQSRIDRVRVRVAELEYSREMRLLDKGVIGRLSNKKRDLAGELAVIPKRVPFKWQRGNKIGKKFKLNLQHEFRVES